MILTAQEAVSTSVDTSSDQEAVNLYDTDWLPASFHEGRREVLREKLPDRSAAVLFAHPVRNRSNDVNYEYHQNPDFYYLTGFNEPNSMLIVFKEYLLYKGDTIRELLFVPGRSPEREIWDGRRLGIDGVKSELGFEHVFENRDFADFNVEFHLLDQILFTLPSEDIRDNNDHRGDLYSLVKHFKRKLDTLLDRCDPHRLGSIMGKMREIKTEEELEVMQKAIDITCKAHLELMKALDTNKKEYFAEAVVEMVFKAEGAEYPGFPSIVGSGENGCILHYVTNRKQMVNGDLVVVDIGAEYHNYTADITRTLPVKGSFTKEQKIIYDIVLKAQRAGIEACRKGNKFWDPHNAATRVIQKELMALGIIKKYYHSRQYFMHGTSHYLGLDVHDAGSYSSLKPGTVITVEPGIYIPEGSDCDPKWWNIGVRIEDDVLITEGDAKVLSGALPVETDEIEAIMKESSVFDEF